MWRKRYREVAPGVFRDPDYQGHVIHVNGPVPDGVRLPSRREPGRVDRLIRDGCCTYVERRSCPVTKDHRDRTCHRVAVCPRTQK